MGSDAASFNFNNNISGGNVQLNQGQTVNAEQTNNVGGPPVSLDEFFAKLTEMLRPVEDHIVTNSDEYSPEVVAAAHDGPPISQVCAEALDAAKQAEVAPQPVTDDDLTSWRSGMADSAPQGVVAAGSIPAKALAIVETIKKKIQFYGPVIGKSIIAFTLAALQSSVAGNPVVAGILAALQQIQTELNKG